MSRYSLSALALLSGFVFTAAFSASPAVAQEVSGKFTGGSVQVGDDTGTCNSTRYGAIRFNANKFQGCSTGGWVDIGTFGGSSADNLGNHTATQALNMANFNITNAGTINGTTITGTAFSGSGASLTALNAANLASGTIPAARLPAYTGDVTKAAGATATTIANNAVTSAKIADLTITNADIANATIVATTKLSATGTKSASTFLRGDNTWAVPPSGGGSAPAGTHCGRRFFTCNASNITYDSQPTELGNSWPCNGSNITATCGGGSPTVNCPSGYTSAVVDYYAAPMGSSRRWGVVCRKT